MLRSISLGTRNHMLTRCVPAFRQRSTHLVTASSLVTTASQGPIYPKSLLIYHSGTFQTATVGMIRISTIFFFAGGCLIGAPAIYFDPGSSTLLCPVIITGSAVPMLLTVALTAPFVASISLMLPGSARTSTQALMRYAQRLPKSAMLELTTMRFLPFPKRLAVKFGELRAIPPGVFKMANLKLVDNSMQRSWWTLTSSRQFFVREGDRYTRSSRAPAVWNLLSNQVRAASRPA